MYKLKSGLCGTVVHILLAYPILTVALGLGGAAIFVKSFILDKPPPYIIETTAKQVMEHPKFQAKVHALEEIPSVKKLTLDAERIFRGILLVESGGRVVKGVHPDRCSYGPAGLTPPALKDVHRKVCNASEKLDYQAILNDPEENVKFAKLYFLDQVHRFKSIKIGAIAYHHGPTRVARWIRRHKPLPEGYWQKILKSLED